MKIIFMGTPDFAVKALEALIEEGHEIGYVISQPDKAKNRGKKVQPTPVKEIALKYGIEVLQPQSIKQNPELLEIFNNYKPDLTVVAAYGRIIPEEYLNIPKYGTVNIHGSLLPRHRGASPVQGAILAGDEKTGVTIMYVVKGLDEGDMIATAETTVANKTCEKLMEELSYLGADLLINAIKDIEKWEQQTIPQDSALATYSGIILKQDGEIDFNKSPEEIERMIRALDPWPGAYTYLNGEQFKIWHSEVLSNKSDLLPGTVSAISDEGIDISAGGRLLRAKIVQIPGKKRNIAKDFLRGYKLTEGVRFGK
ncbi:MAG: methionyl-tRNA formyltransferase [Eubacteriales bacterium]|nr:methionyl-tRNA formyltransferase [Eubacteriales bacterium]MDD4389339.1 methionyl-tRNA formyltransferase [Eubacteriales bacterium]